MKGKKNPPLTAASVRYIGKVSLLPPYAMPCHGAGAGTEILVDLIGRWDRAEGGTERPALHDLLVSRRAEIVKPLRVDCHPPRHRHNLGFSTLPQGTWFHSRRLVVRLGRDCDYN
jgi:hypothetical protein